jgi:hypothetical protein
MINTIQYNTIQYKKIKLASPLHITMISEAQKFIRKTEKDRVQLVSLFLGSTQILLYTQSAYSPAAENSNSNNNYYLKQKPNEKSARRVLFTHYHYHYYYYYLGYQRFLGYFIGGLFL